MSGKGMNCLVLLYRLVYNFRYVLLFVLLAYLGFLVLRYGLYDPASFRSLPSDSEMIENLQRHRADFERLVQIYREDLSMPTDRIFGSLNPTPETKQIMNRVKIDDIKTDREIWLPPNPYSKEIFSGNWMELRIKRGYDDPARRKYSGVILNYVHKAVTRREYMEPVYKRYYYVPLTQK